MIMYKITLHHNKQGDEHHIKAMQCKILVKQSPQTPHIHLFAVTTGSLLTRKWKGLWCLPKLGSQESNDSQLCYQILRCAANSLHLALRTNQTRKSEIGDLDHLNTEMEFNYGLCCFVKVTCLDRIATFRAMSTFCPHLNVSKRRSKTRSRYLWFQVAMRHVFIVQIFDCIDKLQAELHQSILQQSISHLLEDVPGVTLCILLL